MSSLGDFQRRCACHQGLPICSWILVAIAILPHPLVAGRTGPAQIVPWEQLVPVGFVPPGPLNLFDDLVPLVTLHALCLCHSL